MAKKPHHEPQALSSRSTMAILAIGGILVAGLVVWALTRTVEPATASSTTVSSVPASSDLPAVTPPAGTVDTTGTSPAQPTATMAPPVAANPNDAVPRISVGELHDLYARSAVTIVDVRDDTGYFEAHIPGSLHIPMARIEIEAANLPKDKPIVTYCT